MELKIPRITESEWKIMNILWKESPLKAREIIDQLEGTKKWSPKTVKTLLNRLVKKEALGYTREGRMYIYFPIVSEAECVRKERHTFLKRVYNGALPTMLVAFIEDQELSLSEIEELKKILDKKKEK